MKYQDKHLLIIGTGPRYKLPYLRKMLEDGINVTVFVKKVCWEKELPVLVFEVDTDQHDAVMNLVRTLPPIDGVITMWDQDVYNVALIAKTLGLPHVPLNAARVVRDKSLMRHYLVNKSFTPKFRVVENLTELKRAFREIGTPAILKPSGVSASINVRLVSGSKFDYVEKIFQENLETSEKVIADYNLNPDDFRVMIYEEFIDGHEFSVEGYVYDYKYYPLGILEKKKFQFEGTFHPTGDYAPPKSIDYKKQEQLQKTTGEIANIFGLNNCVVHCEMKYCPKCGPKLVEMAARPIGLSGVEVMKLAYGVDLFEINLDLAFGLKPEASFCQRPRSVVSHIINPRKKGVVRKFEVNLEKISKTTCFKIVREGEKTVIPPEGFQHLGWLTVTGDSFDEAERVLDRAKKQVLLDVY